MRQRLSRPLSPLRRTSHEVAAVSSADVIGLLSTLGVLGDAYRKVHFSAKHPQFSSIDKPDEAGVEAIDKLLRDLGHSPRTLAQDDVAIRQIWRV